MYQVGELIVYGGTIRIPVDSKVFMRPVISRQEAEALIDAIPGMHAEACHERNFTQLAARYQQALGSHSCADLIELVMSIYAKKQYAESRKRRFGQVDARFMKRAETLLYGELSVALGIPFEEVQPYISSRIASQRTALAGAGTSLRSPERVHFALPFLLETPSLQ